MVICSFAGLCFKFLHQCSSDALARYLTHW